VPRKKCDCPLYCKYCGAKLRRDSIGHYCPTKNCQWQHGVKGCLGGRCIPLLVWSDAPQGHLA
jgi:hypothetical protein